MVNRPPIYEEIHVGSRHDWNEMIQLGFSLVLLLTFMFPFKTYLNGLTSALAIPSCGTNLHLLQPTCLSCSTCVGGCYGGHLQPTINYVHCTLTVNSKHAGPGQSIVDGCRLTLVTVVIPMSQKQSKKGTQYNPRA